jgi:DNA end-binding protein Ku
MPRSIWNGSLSFGLVNVPVQLFSAVAAKDVHFHEFQAGTGARIKHKRVSERTGKEVEYSDIEKGYETSRAVMPGSKRRSTAQLTAPWRSCARRLDSDVKITVAIAVPSARKPCSCGKPRVCRLRAMARSERVAIARL